MKVIFFGTPYYSVYILDKLYRHLKTSGSTIEAVVTQPPKPSGRDKFLTYSAVDTWAYKKKIKIIRDPASVTSIPADVGVIASYGRLITQNVIDHFPKGIINVHPSILPLFRGASPVQATIATGLEETGVTFFLIDSEMDHGPTLSKFTEDVQPNDTTQTLRDRLFTRASESLPPMLDAYIAGKIKPKVQDEDLATYTKIIKKEDGYIPWKYLKLAINGKSSSDAMMIPFVDSFRTNYSPESIYCVIRALDPWPKTWTKLEIKGKQMRLLIHESKLVEGRIELITVQLEGKKEVPWKQLKEAYSIS